MRGLLFDAVLFDRDGTLVEDVPYNGAPERVRPVAGARQALDRLRAAGLRLGVVTNQSGVARGLFSTDDLAAVNDRIEQLLGPFDTWQACVHAATDACRCRKPAPSMVHAAARALGTVAPRCVVVGDTGADMIAATAAGATGVLVPNAATRADEVAAAPTVAGDLADAVGHILRRERLLTAEGRSRPDHEHRHVLLARPDSAGDVVLTGPAVRAVAAHASTVTLLCGPRGRAAADLLPGVDDVIEYELPWIDPQPQQVDRQLIDRMVARLAALDADEAIIFTSFHQSPLPLALVLRMAGIRHIAAISDDYPGSLLDVRHRVPLGIPEPERALSLAAAAGFPLPSHDQPRLRLRALGTRGLPEPGYVVMHPGSAAPARRCPPARSSEIVTALTAAGHRVLVTGGPTERDLTAQVAGGDGVDLAGRTDLATLAGILAGADCVITGNTGPAHLAAAVGTPVVSMYAPTVPFSQWGPWRVPTVRLGEANAACRHTRATVCHDPAHPCLSGVKPDDVLEAVRLLAGGRA